MKSAQEFTVAGNGRSLSGWRAFTLIELLVVISIIGILAALVVGLVGVATKKSRESQVRAMLAQLVTAIESYKAAKGHYPPDNAANPAQPQLFYELIGTFSADGGATFTTKDRLATVTSVMLNTAFGVPGLVNTEATANRAVSFLSGLKAKQHAPLPSGLEGLVVPAPGAGGVQPNFWRYVSSNPTNNPRSFDLWAEFEAGGNVVTNGNWSSR